MIFFTRLFPLWAIPGALLSILVSLQAMIVMVISIIMSLNQAMWEIVHQKQVLELMQEKLPEHARINAHWTASRTTSAPT